MFISANAWGASTPLHASARNKIVAAAVAPPGAANSPSSLLKLDFSNCFFQREDCLSHREWEKVSEGISPTISQLQSWMYGQKSSVTLKKGVASMHAHLVWKPVQAAVKMLKDKKADDKHQVQLCPGNCVASRYLCSPENFLLQDS